MILFVPALRCVPRDGAFVLPPHRSISAMDGTSTGLCQSNRIQCPPAPRAPARGRRTMVEITDGGDRQDFARLAGVSIATSSRVTSDIDYVSSETRDRVVSAIAELQCCPNAHAAQLARGRPGVTPAPKAVRLRLDQHWGTKNRAGRRQTIWIKRLRCQIDNLSGDLERERMSLKGRIRA